MIGIGNEPDHEDRNRLAVAFTVGAVVIILLTVGLVFLVKATRPGGPVAVQKLPFGAPEQAYVANIHFQDIQMARSSNFLNQQFTFVGGTMSNTGNRTIQRLDVTLEFRDPFNQLILREDEQLIGVGGQPLGPGQQRDFQVILEHVPAEWNQQYPAFHVSGILLQ